MLNVTTSIDLKSGGGNGERTFQMSRALARAGVDCLVLSVSMGFNENRVGSMLPARSVTLPCLWRRFYLPRGGWLTIDRLVRGVDLIHLMGHWSFLNALVYFAAIRHKKPYVVCPAGALPYFGRSKLLKVIYNFLVGNAIIRNASGWIAVTAGELPQFLLYGIPNSKVQIFPNGIYEEDFCPQTPSKKTRLPQFPFILFMGRLNPIKGPDLLLEAFLRFHGNQPNCHLVFAGPDGGMLTELVSFVGRHQLSGRIHFLGHIEGPEKIEAYQSAQLLVVPSRQEAMSIVALEAGILGTPVLLTEECGFNELSLIDSRLVVPATSEHLADALKTLMESPSELAKIGLKTQAFIRSKYTWSGLIPLYLKLYLKIIGF